MKDRYRTNGVPQVALMFPEGENRTHQEFKNDVDINLIMKRFRKTGQLAHVRADQPFYGDFTEPMDYMSCLDRVDAAQEGFLSLPAAVRQMVGNDPAKFLEAIQDPEQMELMMDAGLRVAKADSEEALEGVAKQPQEAGVTEAVTKSEEPKAADPAGADAGAVAGGE